MANLKIVEINEDRKAEYNRFIADNPTGSFLQSWEWGMWQESLAKEVKRFFIKDGESVIAAVQFIKMPIFGNKYYWYAPYGPVTNANFQFSIFNFQTLLQETFREAVFVRIEPQVALNFQHTTLDLPIRKSANIQPGITIVSDVNKSNEELLAAMHPKTRYNIKLAQKHGVEIQSELAVTPGHGLYVQQAVDLIVQTQIRQHYKGHSKDYYGKLIDFFAVHNAQSDLKVRIYKALYQKQLLASGIMVDFGNIRMYLYGGSSDEHKNVMAPYLMHWQAMQDAREIHISMYDFGGSEVSSGGERGFTRFKRGFGGRVVEYAGAHDIIFKKLWYNMYTSLRYVNRFVQKIKRY